MPVTSSLVADELAASLLKCVKLEKTMAFDNCWPWNWSIGGSRAVCLGIPGEQLPGPASVTSA